MSSPTVLLHLGLPKTATSSLQHNVFQKLHQQSRIKFLGKCLDYEYKTGNVKIHNYSGKFIREAVDGDLDVLEARTLLRDSLQENLLNVFSDEGVMVAYPGRDNLTLVEKFERLKAVFEGYRVKVVITLRDPIDYLYSMYVQLYPDFFSRIPELNSVEKYVRKLQVDPDNTLFESFFYDRWVPKLRSNFDVTFIHYESLSNSDGKVFSTWANLLGISSNEFREFFSTSRVNVKKKSGKEVGKVRDFKALEIFFIRTFSSSKSIYRSAKFLYHISGLKKLLNYRFESKKTHSYPSEGDLKRLQEILKVESKFYE